MRERLAFLHLPKSAGTSYRHAIAQYYSIEDTVPWSFDLWSFGNHVAMSEVPQPILLDDAADVSAYRYMEGHFSLPTIRRGFAASEVVCILREPRSRLLSHYAFWRSWGPELRDQWLPFDVPRAARQSLAAFCADGEAAHQADNLIARLVIGPHPLIPTDRSIQAEHCDELIRIGTARLDELGFVGVLERGESTFDDLETWFGSPLDRVRLNETGPDGGPPLVAHELTSARANRLLHERTSIDRALWLHVAVRAGLGAAEAASLADAAFSEALDRLVERTRLQVEGPPPDEPVVPPDEPEVDVGPAGEVADIPSAPRRIVALIRCGPKAVLARVIADPLWGRLSRRRQ